MMRPSLPAILLRVADETDGPKQGGDRQGQQNRTATRLHDAHHPAAFSPAVAGGLSGAIVGAFVAAKFPPPALRLKRRASLGLT